MQPGDVIRKYRKNKDMTQEELAKRLGVTAPAVNKWENGNSLPDITLLAPIARLLGITTDILLSFRDELTGDELRAIIYELDSMLKE
ncbi:helix-turn-helix domain-containing protein, partial [Hungatella sp.]